MALNTCILDNGLCTDWQARSIYCVEVSYDEGAKEWKVDEPATAELRQAKRKERSERGVPVKEWWEKSRARLLEHDIDPQLLEMYGSSAKLSPAFAQEFRDFWGLPDDYAFCGEE